MELKIERLQYQETAIKSVDNLYEPIEKTR